MGGISRERAGSDAGQRMRRGHAPDKACAGHQERVRHGVGKVAAGHGKGLDDRGRDDRARRRRNQLQVRARDRADESRQRGLSTCTEASGAERRTSTSTSTGRSLSVMARSRRISSVRAEGRETGERDQQRRRVGGGAWARDDRNATRHVGWLRVERVDAQQRVHVGRDGGFLCHAGRRYWRVKVRDEGEGR